MAFQFVLLAALALGATATRPEGIEYLKKVAAEPDTVVVPSGLLYKVLESGDENVHSPGDRTSGVH